MKIKYVVTFERANVKYWLRGTTWTFHAVRANEFDTQQKAQDAAKRAEMFMAPAVRKNYKIETVSL